MTVITRSVVGLALVVVAACASIVVLTWPRGDDHEYRAVASAAVARSAGAVVATDVWSAAVATSTTATASTGAAPSRADGPPTTTTTSTTATETDTATPSPTATAPAPTAPPEPPAPPTTDAATCEEVLDDVLAQDGIPTAGEAQWLWVHCHTRI